MPSWNGLPEWHSLLLSTALLLPYLPSPRRRVLHRQLRAWFIHPAGFCTANYALGSSTPPYECRQDLGRCDVTPPFPDLNPLTVNPTPPSHAAADRGQRRNYPFHFPQPFLGQEPTCDPFDSEDSSMDEDVEAWVMLPPRPTGNHFRPSPHFDSHKF